MRAGNASGREHKDRMLVHYPHLSSVKGVRSFTAFEREFNDEAPFKMFDPRIAAVILTYYGTQGQSVGLCQVLNN